MPDKVQDAIALLKADHRAVEDLFEEFAATTAPAKQKALATKICTELLIHTMIEEEILYPVMTGDVDSDLVDEAYVEHDGAKLLISQIMAAEPGDRFFAAKVKVLSEEIKHHVKEEEEPGEGLFALAKDANLDLKALGAQMAVRKAELMAQFKANGVPIPTARTLSAVEIELGEPVA